MPIPTKLILTRAQIDRALARADVDDLSGVIRPRLMSVLDGAGLGQTCMDLLFEHPQELALVLFAMFQALDPADAELFATEIRTEGAHAYWPGIVIEGELSPEQEADALNAARVAAGDPDLEFPVGLTVPVAGGA